MDKVIAIYYLEKMWSDNIQNQKNAAPTITEAQRAHQQLLSDHVLPQLLLTYC